MCKAMEDMRAEVASRVRELVIAEVTAEERKNTVNKKEGLQMLAIPFFCINN